MNPFEVAFCEAGQATASATALLGAKSGSKHFVMHKRTVSLIIIPECWSAGGACGAGSSCRTRRSFSLLVRACAKCCGMYNVAEIVSRPACGALPGSPYWLIEVDVAKLSWCYRYKFDGGRSPPFFLRELKLAVGVVRV